VSFHDAFRDRKSESDPATIAVFGLPEVVEQVFDVGWRDPGPGIDYLYEDSLSLRRGFK
jgi:hypothetical protein